MKELDIINLVSKRNFLKTKISNRYMRLSRGKKCLFFGKFYFCTKLMVPQAIFEFRCFHRGRSFVNSRNFQNVYFQEHIWISSSKNISKPNKRHANFQIVKILSNFQFYCISLLKATLKYDQLIIDIFFSILISCALLWYLSKSELT